MKNKTNTNQIPQSAYQFWNHWLQCGQDIDVYYNTPVSDQDDDHFTDRWQHCIIDEWEG